MHSKFQVLHIPLAHWETSNGPHHKGHFSPINRRINTKYMRKYGQVCNLPVDNAAVAAPKNTLCTEEENTHLLEMPLIDSTKTQQTGVDYGLH